MARPSSARPSAVGVTRGSARCVRQSLDPADVVERLKCVRRHPIGLFAVRARQAACGVWRASATSHYVVYERDTSPLHPPHAPVPLVSVPGLATAGVVMQKGWRSPQDALCRW